jgi:hypothetical protein
MLTWFTGLSLAGAPGAVSAAPAQYPVDDALAWLEGAQNPSGSWGTTFEFTDTATVVESVTFVDPGRAAALGGATWLNDELASNSQCLARRISALSETSGFEPIAVEQALALLTLRNAAELDPSLPNWPEGGWGVAQGFASDCMTTALALLALESAGLAAGISVEDEPLAANSAKNHSWTIAAAATKARILIAVAGSTVRLRMKQGSPPTNADPFFSLAPGTYLIVFPDSGLPFTPGLNFIRVQNTTAVAASYSFTASYQTPEIDTRAFGEALDYLEQAQNPDGGWGIQRGMSTELFTSLHVLLALRAYPGYDLDAERAAAVAFVQGEQLPGGGFGFDGMTALAHVTALAALNLVRAESFPFGMATDDAISALLAMQGMDGSWASEPYHTALAVRALWEHNQPPTADAGADQDLDDLDDDGFEDVMLFGSGMDVDGFIADYSWSEGGTTIASGPTPTVALALGSHAITLTVTDDQGRTAGDVVAITVHLVCDPVTSFICASSGRDVLLSWTNGDDYPFVDVYRDGALIGSTAPGATSFTDLDVPIGIHTYSLIGACGGTDFAPAVECTIAHRWTSPPSRPSGPPAPANPVGLPLGRVPLPRPAPHRP